MKYIVRLKSREEFVVDRGRGQELRKMFLDLDVDRSTPIDVDGNVFTLGRVVSVFKVKESVARHDTVSEDVEDKKFYEQLAGYANESVSQKVERELSARIKSGLPKNWKPDGYTLGDIEKFLVEFFTKNPKYPWCPSKHWLGMLFPRGGNVPLFYEFVAKNDNVVYLWLKGKRV